MSSKPMFVMVTADTCGHCQNLHKKWRPIRETIQSLGTVRITEVKLPKMNAKVADHGYPSGIQNHLQWFPTGLMFSGEVWDRAVKNGGEEEMPGLVMSPQTPLTAEEMPGLVMSPQTPLTAEGITGWIRSNVSKLPGSKKSESKSPALPVGRPTFIPTSGSRRVCQEMNIKPRRRYW